MVTFMIRSYIVEGEETNYHDTDIWIKDLAELPDHIALIPPSTVTHGDQVYTLVSPGPETR